MLSLYRNPSIHILSLHSIVYEDLLTQILILLNSLLHFFIFSSLFSNISITAISFISNAFISDSSKNSYSFSEFSLQISISVPISLKINISCAVTKLSSPIALFNKKFILLILLGSKSFNLYFQIFYWVWPFFMCGKKGTVSYVLKQASISCIST